MRIFELEAEYKKAKAIGMWEVTNSDQGLLQKYLKLIDLTTNSRKRIIEIQDRLETNMMREDSGFGITVTMPDGQEQRFATYLHYVSTLLSGLAGGQYDINELEPLGQNDVKVLRVD